MEKEHDEITDNCKDMAEKLKAMLDTAFGYLRQQSVLVTVEIEEDNVHVLVDGEFAIVLDYREREDASLISMECIHEPILDFEYDIFSIEHDSGCRYHSDGSGTPPSEEWVRLEASSRMVSACNLVLSNYMDRRIRDVMEEIEMKT